MKRMVILAVLTAIALVGWTGTSIAENWTRYDIVPQTGSPSLERCVWARAENALFCPDSVHITVKYKRADQNRVQQLLRRKLAEAADERDPILAGFDKGVSDYVASTCIAPPPGYGRLRGIRFQLQAVADKAGDIKVEWVGNGKCHWHPLGDTSTPRE